MAIPMRGSYFLSGLEHATQNLKRYKTLIVFWCKDIERKCGVNQTRPRLWEGGGEMDSGQDHSNSNTYQTHPPNPKGVRFYLEFDPNIHKTLRTQKTQKTPKTQDTEDPKDPWDPL